MGLKLWYYIVYSSGVARVGKGSTCLKLTLTGKKKLD